MKREYALEFSRVTEAAALACISEVGRGNKEEADQLAVNAMRDALQKMNFQSEIIIGEGEIDNAPMLYIGEKLGNGGAEIDIAVDPIDGTRMVAMGQPNAIAVLAAGEKGAFMQAPDMYMEKLVVNSAARGIINLNNSLEQNLIEIAKAYGKKIEELKVMTLAKPRHDKAIALMHKLGVKVYAIPDGDVAATLLVCLPSEGIDVFYGIGGAPEGVISATLVSALDGDMKTRLLTRSEVKGKSPENDLISISERERCDEMGCKINEVIPLSQLVKSENVIFSATGITGGNLLQGVKMLDAGKFATTETLLIRGKTGTIRKIHSTHIIK